MRKYCNYEYKDWIFKYSFWMGLILIALILWLLPYQARTRTFSVRYEFDELSFIINFLIIIFVMAVYSLPLFGIKRRCEKNEANQRSE